MSADLKKIEEEAFSLPAPERAHLAMSLIERGVRRPFFNPFHWLHYGENRWLHYADH